MGAYDATETLPAFDALGEAGPPRHVGLSNFTPDLLAAARDHSLPADALPADALDGRERVIDPKGAPWH
jgi:aryl-alcohol dehydrogenase-like predicted oxidoreductase